MDPTRYFHAQACNNAWANHRLLTAVGRLTAEDLTASRTSFFPSILATLNHILIVDWFYVDALEGGDLGVRAFEQDVPCSRFADLDREQRAVDQRLIRFCDALTVDRLASECRMHRAKHVQVDRVDRVLLHLFEHQIHHRGQVHAMLSGTNVEPPQLDEFFMTGEAHLRDDDLRRIGLTEQKVWG